MTLDLWLSDGNFIERYSRGMENRLMRRSEFNIRSRLKCDSDETKTETNANN